MSFSSVLFPTGSYTVTRTVRGTTTLGRYTAGSTSTVTITADVQHVSGDLRRDLPEGVRTEETRIMYTTAVMYAQNEAFDADVVAIDGDNWKVIRVDRFRVFADRWRAIVERIRP